MMTKQSMPYEPSYAKRIIIIITSALMALSLIVIGASVLLSQDTSWIQELWSMSAKNTSDRSGPETPRRQNSIVANPAVCQSSCSRQSQKPSSAQVCTDQRRSTDQCANCSTATVHRQQVRLDVTFDIHRPTRQPHHIIRHTVNHQSR